MSTAKNDVQMDGSLIHEHFADHLSVKIVTAKSKESVAVDSISPHSLRSVFFYESCLGIRLKRSR